jgi:thioredoxin 1
MGKFSDIVKSDTPTLVDFFATWCGPCQAMSPVLDKLKAEMGSQVRVLKIDVDSHEGFVLSGAYEFFNKNNPVILIENKSDL